MTNDSENKDLSEIQLVDLSKANRLIGEVQSIIRKHQKRQSCSQGSSIPEQVDIICEEYQRSAENAFTAASEFRDRMCVDMRALNLIITSALNSETHKEKDAHLRILSKLLASALEKLRETHFQSVWGASYYFNKDPFQCDFPVREMKNRIYELEAKVKELEPSKDETSTTAPE